MNAPSRICSLLPSATEIIARLGLADRLVGVSAECRCPPEVLGKPVVSSARIDPTTLSSAEIDRRVRESTAEGSLYAVDAELIDRLAPDLIVTQDLCAVCAVSAADLTTACPLDVEILSLDPRTLGEVAESVTTLAARLGAEDRGRALVAEMWGKIEQVERALAGAGIVPVARAGVIAGAGAVAGAGVTAGAGLARPRVFLAEWIDPPYSGGHWIPEMIELAGGTCVLGSAGEPSRRVDWRAVLREDPELVVVAPCGFGAEEAARRAAELRLPCRAVAVDSDSSYSRPAPRLADGVRQLGHLLHPDVVADPGLPAIELTSQASALARVGGSDLPYSIQAWI